MDNIHLNSTLKLIAGCDKVADAVKLTLGAGGSNAVIEVGLTPFHRITNDGVTIAKSIILSDPIENIGANIIKEIAGRAHKYSGDGTTTATVLAQAILHEGLKYKDNALEIKESLDACIPEIEKGIDEIKKEITVESVGKVATISSEDEEIGNLIQEIYQKIGKDGIIEMDNSNLSNTFYEIVDGVRIRTGYFGEYSCTSQGKAEYKNPKILISKEKISTIDQIEGIVKKLVAQNITGMVLYCEDIDMAVASRIALTHLNGNFKTHIIKAPTLWKDWIYEDLPQLIGATPIDYANGKTFKNIEVEDLGTCDKLISTKDETRILGTKDIAEYIKAFDNTSGNTSDDDAQKLRISWLNTKVGILKIGANSEAELSYKRLKTIDAINASKLALDEGVVCGGGVTLYQLTTNDTLGGKILSKVLSIPLQQIIENAGGDKEIIKTLKKDEGYNAKTHKVVNMWEDDIIDPAKVVKNAIISAISVAGTILTTRSVITLDKPEMKHVVNYNTSP